MMNMSRVSKLISLLAAATVVVACGSDNKVDDKATIAGVVAGAPSSDVVIGMLDMNQLVILDTLKTGADGSFKYELKVKKGDPEFLYVYSDGKKVTSLLLNAGDNVSFTVDAEGNSVIKGSEESEKLMQVEKEHAKMSALFADLYADLESASSDAQFTEATQEIVKNYRDYNRASVKYLMENCHSMSVIQVLYRKVSDNLPLFNDVNDAILFSSIADSLAKAYPNSRYVKSLRAEADARFRELELQKRVDEAARVGYFDVELPGLDGQRKKLSDLDSKVVLLYFWTASNAGQNNFNVDVLKKLYNQYHSKGFDIYQVSLDVDKVMWATTVMGQNLPWTNVCDIRGVASPYVAQYNIQQVPAAFVISNGELVDGDVVDEASFRRLLEKHLN